MKLRLMGTFEEVAQITPGLLTLNVVSVSEPYENRKGTPRLWRVYLEGDLVAGPAAGADSADAATTTVRRSDRPAAPPLEIEGGGR